MEEKLIALLQNAGREDLAVALERDEELDDFIAKHSDELKTIPGFIDLMQPATSSAPHGLSKEDAKEFFTDIKGKVDKRAYNDYFKQEAKYNSELAKKQQLADEYARAQDIKNASKFGWERPTKDMSFSDGAKLAAKNLNNNLLALGLTLTPQAAKNVYIKEGYKPGKLALQGGLGTMANVSELLPGPGKIGKVITTFGGPAVRAAQDIFFEDKPLSEAGSRFAHDAGLNTLFEYMPVQEAYNYAKRILGKQGGAGEKAAADIVGETLEKADALEHLKDLKDARRARMREVTNFQQDYEHGLVNDLDALKFAESIEDEFPKVAESLRKEINLNAASRQADIRSKTAITDKTKAQVAADRTLADKKIPEQHEIVRTDLRDARKEAKDKYLLSDLKVDPEGYLIRPAADLKQAYKVYNPSKAAKVIAEVAPTGRKLAKTYTGPDRESSAPEDKDYNNAIEYIISNYKRQWDAGFKPRGGIELEAWKKYKGIE